MITQVSLARISHQDHGSRRRIRIRKRRSGAKSVAIATVGVKSKLTDKKTSLNRDRHDRKTHCFSIIRAFSNGLMFYKYSTPPGEKCGLAQNHIFSWRPWRLCESQYQGRALAKAPRTQSCLRFVQPNTGLFLAALAALRESISKVPAAPGARSSRSQTVLHHRWRRS